MRSVFHECNSFKLPFEVEKSVSKYVDFLINEWFEVRSPEINLFVSNADKKYWDGFWCSFINSPLWIYIFFFYYLINSVGWYIIEKCPCSSIVDQESNIPVLERKVIIHLAAVWVKCFFELSHISTLRKNFDFIFEKILTFWNGFW